MSQQLINLGSPPAGADGDTIRTALTKCNGNFSDLYGQLGAKMAATVFTSNVNANASMPCGSYGSYAEGATNAPEASGVLLHFVGPGDGCQIWQGYSNGRMYHRQRWGGAWSGWYQIWTTASTTVDANNFIKKA